MERAEQMAEEGQFRRIDLSRVNVRVRCVLRRMNVRSVEGLLDLREGELLSMQNCGAKTTAGILRLQAEYGKDITSVNLVEGINEVLEGGRGYMNRLIAVALAANDVVVNAKRDAGNRYYYRVTTKRFNVVKEALEALGGEPKKRVRELK